MSNEGGGNEGPVRTDFQESRKVPDCGAHCEHIHGDQAPSPEDLAIASLQREVADLKAEIEENQRVAVDAGVEAIAMMVAQEREACAKLAEEAPRQEGCEGGATRALADTIAAAIRARGAR